MGWLQIFLTSIPLFIGLFSGWVTSRIARKTPHENLKALVELKAAVDSGVDPEGIIDKAIELELQRLKQSTVSEDAKWYQIVWGRALDNLAAVLVGCFVVVYFTVLIVALNRFGGSMGGDGTNQKGDSDILLAIVGVAVAGALVLGAAYARFKRDQALLRN
jgi:hypothetical protein